jgi:hypothetical protein
MKDGYIPIAGVGFYHFVPGHINGSKAFRAGAMRERGI